MRLAVVAIGLAAVAACRTAVPPAPAPAPASKPVPRWRLPMLEPRLVPQPASLALTGGPTFVLDSGAAIVAPSTADAQRTANLLAGVLRPSTGYAIPVITAEDASTRPTSGRRIVLQIARDRTALGDEGYELTVTRDSVLLVAFHPAGLFRGTQTLRQLFPPAIESHLTLQAAWEIPALRIADQPRFAWRGAMLDVARHFFTVDEVKQYIDILALYKLNVLHLHLSDDQGWRIEIKSRPKLATMGGATEVGGGPGGYYTQEQYTDLVRYAADRYITIVPEIDLPGHTNAALVAYPELSCSRRPPALYTGTEVGWSTVCPEKDGTYALIDDVVREIAALSPGAYFHIGGDEVEELSDSTYAAFVERVESIVTRHGKRMVGWEEVAKARLRPTSIVQQWRGDTLGAHALRHGGKMLVSPAKRMYNDMKYSEEMELGLTWAAVIGLRDAYDWDPATFNPGVAESSIIGVESPLWSETIRSITAAMYLAMPRLPAYAEIGWTPQPRRDWEQFRERLAAHASRWNLLGVNYHRSPEVPW